MAKKIPTTDQALDRDAARRAADVLRSRQPDVTPLAFGPVSKMPREGWILHCPDGATLRAVKALAEMGPALVDALARAEAAGGGTVAG